MTSLNTSQTPNVYHKLSCFSKRLHVNKISGVLHVKPPFYRHCEVILYSCLQILKYITVFSFIFVCVCVLLELASQQEYYATFPQKAAVNIA